MKKLIVLVALVLSFVLSPVVAEVALAGDNNFNSPTVGFEIVKPDGWVYMSMDEVAEARANIRLDDKDLEELIKTRARMPLVVMTKYPEPHADLNPSVQVTFSPLGAAKDMSATEILSQTMGMVKSMAEDFTLVDGIKEIEVDGFKGAYMKASYTVKNPEGREFKTTSRLWFIKRGAFAFMVGASGPQSGADMSEKEFAEIVASIKIAK